MYMKRMLFLSFLAGFLMIGTDLFSQGTSLTVIADNGEKFTMEVNGNLESSKPQSRVTVDGLYGPSIKVVIYIDGAEVAPVAKSIFNKPNSDFYYVLHRNIKGIYVIDPVSPDYVPGGSSAQAESPAPPPAKEPKSKEPAQAKSSPKTAGCNEPLTADEFTVFYKSVSARPFEGTRLSGAKSVVVEKCITVDQLIDLINLLSLEPSKLDLAKYAYLHVHDPQNYSLVDEVFLSGSSVESLHKYISSKQ